MNRFIITLLLASQLPLHAQEVSAELRSNISELISIRVANRQRSIADSLGKAFRPDIYREQFNKVLLGGTPVENDDATDCPAATAMANGILKQFDPQDYDAAGILQRVETHLATPAPETEEEMKKAYEEYEKLTEQVQKGYRPVLRAREHAKEQEILRGNAERSSVVQLDFGVQMEVEPGTDTIRKLNRGTTETGIAYYTRTTRRMEWNDLPEAIRLQEDKLPAARSWTFWVPTEAEQKVAEFKQQRLQNEENRRAELMKQLLGNRKPTTTKKPVARAEAKDDTQQEERPMMKIKVWRDDPKAPVKTLPDVVSDMI
ncbi:MAG: hypothetical protein IKW48_03150 [Akkermansia sp.]|nr:hypothetical protein [Akkermansia sp.]